jgi:hypothetical protein
MFIGPSDVHINCKLSCLRFNRVNSIHTGDCCSHVTTSPKLTGIKVLKVKVKVQQSRYRSEVAQRVSGN